MAAMRRRRFLRLAGMAGAGLAVVGSRLLPELGAIGAQASGDWTAEALSPDATESLRLASLADPDANRLRELLSDPVTEAEVRGLRSQGADLTHDLAFIQYVRAGAQPGDNPIACLVHGTGTVSAGQYAGQTYPVRLLLRQSDRSAWSANQLRVAQGADDEVSRALLDAVLPQLDLVPSPGPYPGPFPSPYPYPVPSPSPIPGPVPSAATQSAGAQPMALLAARRQPIGQDAPPLPFKDCYKECFGSCSTMLTAGVVTVAAGIGCAATWWTVILTPITCGAAAVGAVVTAGSSYLCIRCRLGCEQYNEGLQQIQQQPPPPPPQPQ
jgi:hypothetical protein